jgi:hypothetical protein
MVAGANFFLLYGRGHSLGKTIPAQLFTIAVPPLAALLFH